MKTIKYLIAGLAIAFALAGCTGSTGSANFDSGVADFNPIEETTGM